MKIEKIREMSSEDLNKELSELKTELFKLRFNLATNGLDNPMKIKEVKKDIKKTFNADDFEKEKELTKYMIEKISMLPKVRLFIPNSKKVFGIVSIAVEGYSSDDVASILSEEFDIKVRAGYHCSPFVHQFIGSEEYKGTVRISLGAFNTLKDIDKLYDALLTL